MPTREANMAMDYQSLSAVELLGPLNEVERKHAPPVLFFAGDRGILDEGARVSIVGSREASREGLLRARRLAKVLTKNHVVVVSGLAEGIDTAGHTAAIESGGRTIAVLGTPLNRAYPKSNAALQTEIMEKHLCISQFMPGQAVHKGNFPSRNRTMALISDATVIVEASDKSGSLHQGWEALRLGRNLFLAKAIVESAEVTWPEKMLHYGARVLTEDVLEEFLELLPPRRSTALNGDFSF